jgi:hypothetical protein
MTFASFVPRRLAFLSGRRGSPQKEEQGQWRRGYAVHHTREVEMENSIGRLGLFLAAGIVVALLPLSVAEAKNYCQDNLVQAQLRSFESQCTKNNGAQSHCAVNISKVPNDFRCCCTYSQPSTPSGEQVCPKGYKGTPPNCANVVDGKKVIFF